MQKLDKNRAEGTQEVAGSSASRRTSDLGFHPTSSRLGGFTCESTVHQEPVEGIDSCGPAVPAGPAVQKIHISSGKLGAGLGERITNRSEVSTLALSGDRSWAEVHNDLQRTARGPSNRGDPSEVSFSGNRARVCNMNGLPVDESRSKVVQCHERTDVARIDSWQLHTPQDGSNSIAEYLAMEYKLVQEMCKDIRMAGFFCPAMLDEQVFAPVPCPKPLQRVPFHF